MSQLLFIISIALQLANRPLSKEVCFYHLLPDLHSKHDSSGNPFQIRNIEKGCFAKKHLAASCVKLSQVKSNDHAVNF